MAAAHPFACDVPDCLCRHQKYLQNGKRMHQKKKIAGTVYGPHHPISQRVDLWVLQHPQVDAMPAADKSICSRCASHAKKQIKQETNDALPDSPSKNTRAQHTEIRKRARAAGEFFPRSKRKFSLLAPDTKAARMRDALIDTIV